MAETHRGAPAAGPVSGLEWKFHRPDEGLTVTDGTGLSGYASLFGVRDGGGDVVMPGAYGAALAALRAGGRTVKMLWQHDPAEPIGVWDRVTEDTRGLHVRGRLLTDVARGRDAVALVGAGAVDGLSIGYRVRRAERGADGVRRLLEIELWEVSLVTFPMLAEARVGAKGGAPDTGGLRDLAAAIEGARRRLTVGRGAQPGDFEGRDGR